MKFVFELANGSKVTIISANREDAAVGLRNYERMLRDYERMQATQQTLNEMFELGEQEGKAYASLPEGCEIPCPTGWEFVDGDFPCFVPTTIKANEDWLYSFREGYASGYKAQSTASQDAEERYRDLAEMLDRENDARSAENEATDEPEADEAATA